MMKRYHYKDNLYFDEFLRIHKLSYDSGIPHWEFTGRYLERIPKDSDIQEFVPFRLPA